MNKLTYTFVLTLVSVMSIAQEGAARAERGGRFPSNSDNFGNPEVMTPPAEGSQIAPIDDYTFLLIGMALLIIAYVVYQRSQLKKA